MLEWLAKMCVMDSVHKKTETTFCAAGDVKNKPEKLEYYCSMFCVLSERTLIYIFYSGCLSRFKVVPS